MVRYLILRTLIFVGCLAATWLIGLRDREDQLLAVVIAAVASLVISAFVLKPFREQASAAIAGRVDERVERKREKAARSDEAAEDAETDLDPAGRDGRSKGDESDSDFR
ncbi:membrane protein [Knoellia subterranea KCTC 19937]|uniref:Membrane protein n=2 Tax=Knoellia TaxID=136099 RepID=A0A0A0JL76_9MICO|nr:membrane protein [Knoellia subterranea KCTC 19937]